MKHFLFVLLFLSGLSGYVLAADGYKIKLKFTDIDLREQKVYIAHYYAKPLPTIYKSDSAIVNNDGFAVFQTKEKIIGGIYMVLLSDMKTYFEFLLDNGADFEVTAISGTLPLGVKYKNSPENERFQEYVVYLRNFSNTQERLQAQLLKAKTKDDSVNVFIKANASAKELRIYRQEYAAKYPNTLLANIFGALYTPEVPAPHYLSDKKTIDSNYTYEYYKQHYWDNFNFTDDRLMNTPVYDAKLETYFNTLVSPSPDSVQKEGDRLLAKTKKRTELFKYTLHWLTQYTKDSKVMGMDQAFVYFVENYHMKGDAFWMDSDLLSKYIDKARRTAPNVIGNIAPEIKMVDWNNKEYSLLSDIKAKYTLLVFWSPDCGACQKEVPQIDSLYRAVLKNKGVKVFAVRTEGDEKQWKSFVEKHNIKDWVNVYDPEHKSDYKSKYDVYGTPVLYLLDENKIIRGKKLDHSNIATVIDMLEAKEKPLNKKS
jgi:peroxiredoxin